LGNLIHQLTFYFGHHWTSERIERETLRHSTLQSLKLFIFKFNIYTDSNLFIFNLKITNVASYSLKRGDTCTL